MNIETLIETLTDRDLLKEAATIVDEFWEDDYAGVVAEKGADYSILDFAADVIRDASDSDLETIGELLKP